MILPPFRVEEAKFPAQRPQVEEVEVGGSVVVVVVVVVVVFVVVVSPSHRPSATHLSPVPTLVFEPLIYVFCVEESYVCDCQKMLVQKFVK